MLDKFRLKILSYLNKISQTGEYKVLTFDDIKKYLNDKELTNEIIEKTLDFLSNNEYIKIKFQDDEQICFCSLAKSKFIENDTKAPNNDKKALNKMILLNIIFSSISAFLGAFLAILVVHFFL